MATVVRLSEEQIDKLLADADAMERSFKDMHEELARLDTPKETLARFGKLHDRFSGALDFLRRQRELGR